MGQGAYGTGNQPREGTLQIKSGETTKKRYTEKMLYV